MITWLTHSTHAATLRTVLYSRPKSLNMPRASSHLQEEVDAEHGKLQLYLEGVSKPSPLEARR